MLYNVTQILDNRYSGKVFVRLGATGHMFNQHYMNELFPLTDKNGEDQRSATGPDTASATPKPCRFLDQVVHVDEAVAQGREACAVRGMCVLGRESSGMNEERGSRAVRRAGLSSRVRPPPSAASLPSPPPALSSSNVDTTALDAVGHDALTWGDGQNIPVSVLSGEALEALRREGPGREGAMIHFMEAGAGVREARGKTVRQLSRLWRYVDGGNVDD